MTQVQQVRNILAALSNMAHLVGFSFLEVYGEGKKVHVKACCVGHELQIMDSFKRVGLKAIYRNYEVIVWYPSQDELRRMQ